MEKENNEMTLEKWKLINCRDYCRGWAVGRTAEASQPINSPIPSHCVKVILEDTYEYSYVGLSERK